jgi:N-acetylmuramoyl-L-alanine amidase
VKRIVFIFGIIASLIILPFSSHSQFKVRKVVIDAGHGGKDPGASGKTAREKDIALAIALKTGFYIEKYLPDVQVIYTRDKDEFVELHRRAAIANKAGADLFISIHCNANRSASPFGTETYVMGLHKNSDNLDVAKLENAAILKEENYSDMYEGFDPTQDEDYITLSLFQDGFLDQSTLFADKVQSQFRERVNRKDRGVKQAGFRVLYKTAMPGVLIETGFLSNSKDEAFLRSTDGQTYMASAIYRAFKEYKTEIERVDNKARVVTDYKPEEEASQISYRVQFASYSKSKPPGYRKFKGLEDVREYQHNGMYKYTTGNFTRIENARALQEKLRKNSKYKDAFVVAFRDNKRLIIN